MRMLINAKGRDGVVIITDATCGAGLPAGTRFKLLGVDAQTTDRLPPEIAGAYNIVRSKNRAMITVSLIDEETGAPTAGDVSVKTVQRRVNRAVVLLSQTVGDLRPEDSTPIQP